MGFVGMTVNVPAKTGVIGQPMTHLPAELLGDFSEHVLGFIEFSHNNTANAAACGPFSCDFHPQRTAALN